MRRHYAFEAENLTEDVRSQLERVETAVDSKCTSVSACESMLNRVEAEEKKFNGALESMIGSAKAAQSGSIDRAVMSRQIAPVAAELKEIAGNIGVATESAGISQDELLGVRSYLNGAKEIVESKLDELSRATESDEGDEPKDDKGDDDKKDEKGDEKSDDKGDEPKDDSSKDEKSDDDESEDSSDDDDSDVKDEKSEDGDDDDDSDEEDASESFSSIGIDVSGAMEGLISRVRDSAALAKTISDADVAAALDILYSGSIDNSSEANALMKQASSEFNALMEKNGSPDRIQPKKFGRNKVLEYRVNGRLVEVQVPVKGDSKHFRAVSARRLASTVVSHREKQAKAEAKAAKKAAAVESAFDQFDSYVAAMESGTSVDQLDGFISACESAKSGDPLDRLPYLFD